MIVVPAATPVTLPDPSTVALAVLVLVQVPPLMLLVSAVVRPVHTVFVPPITGDWVTFNNMLLEQPAAVVYDIVVLPPATPVTVTGEPAEPIVAADVLLLLQVPPVVASLNVIVEALHMVVAPWIAVIGATDTVPVVLQPVADTRYVIVATPDALPVTSPLPSTDALVLLLLHTPPAVASLRVVINPTHTDTGVPRIGVIGLTLTVMLLAQPLDPMV